MDKLPPICSAVILIKRVSDEMPKIVSLWPNNFSLGDEDLYFKASVNIHENSSSPSVFLFNTPMYSCISLNFEYNMINYSLVTLTEYPFFHFYKEIFQIACKDFQKNHSDSTPINRFYYIVTPISSIPKSSTPNSIIFLEASMEPLSISLQCFLPFSPHLVITFPSKEFEYTFTPNTFSYRDFDPTLFFNPTQCYFIWRALFMNQPILFYSKNPIIGSTSVIAAASLLSPLPFTDEMCLWLTETDPRFISVINEESKLMIAATNSASLVEANEHFKHVIYLDIEANNLPQDADIVKQLFTKMRRALILANAEFDRVVTEVDPYYDLIGGKLCTDQFAQTLKSYSKYDIPTIEEFKEWENTVSFKNWRRKRTIENCFRDGVLNTDPRAVFENKTKDEVEKIFSKMGELMEKYSNDTHVIAVLKKHKRIARDMLSSFH
ncbi:hypothetical protein M9Y10_035140 [Tritrichomonas musculus]|uniref:UDENN domain-containing protein n=1 Tax=Tritrichomonas musculus TaxID=1915356 RepID=A0ABR2KGV8_9EUKA